jgi:enoyl-CoA hydratase/carnithine racemase
MINRTLDDNIIIATIENGKYNSITIEALRALKAMIDEVNSTPEIRGLILTGTGGFFSSGFNLPMFLGFKDHGEVVGFFEEEEPILIDYFTCSKPVICAMNGHTAAMGMILAMASDYRIVINKPKLKLGMSEIKIGLPLSPVMSEVMRFGLDTDKKFRDVMYFGNMMNPETAKEMGIVDEIVEPDQLIARAKEVVKMWIDTPGRPFIPMKRMLKAEAVGKMHNLFATQPWKEALHCFFEKDVRGALEFTQAMMAG